MSASPPATTIPSTKRPLEDPSSPSAPNDQPDAKRPALDKIIKDEDASVAPESTVSPATANGEEVKEETNGHVETKDEKDAEGDTKLPDAAAPVMDTMPIQTTTTSDRASATPSGHQDESTWIHIRAVISSAEAATVIGKGGENVTQIRRLSGAKCTVSDYSRGAVERILTVSGQVDAVAKVRVLNAISRYS
jgi:heterogeneous nuclear rnp K-like protein